MADNREWYRTNGATALNEIIKASGMDVAVRFDPTQDGYFWQTSSHSSDAPYHDPYDALQAFIIFVMRYYVTQALHDTELPF